MAKELPGHIAAALQRAGGMADSAGVPWAGRDLSGSGNPLHDFDADDGSQDAGYGAAIDGLVARESDEARVVDTLSRARVFVPIVAEVAAEAPGHLGTTADKEADMALVWLHAPDGRKALPVFSSASQLQAWHPEARPVAVYAPRAALSAVSEGSELMVVDPGADFTFVVRRPALWALAQQHVWSPSYQDREVAALLEAAVAKHPSILGVVVRPGDGVASRTAAGAAVPGGGPGPELLVSLQLSAGLDAEMVRDVVSGLQDALASDSRFTDKVDSLEVRLTN